VLVVDFNDNTTKVLYRHLQWAMTAVSAAPESSTEVLAHPNKIEAEEWAAVKDILPGNLTMVTLAPWEDGRIAEEYLFRNNPSAILNQMGSRQ
jgi:hypothetical protein